MNSSLYNKFENMKQKSQNNAKPKNKSNLTMCIARNL